MFDPTIRGSQQHDKDFLGNKRVEVRHPFAQKMPGWGVRYAAWTANPQRPLPDAKQSDVCAYTGLWSGFVERNVAKTMTCRSQTGRTFIAGEPAGCKGTPWLPTDPLAGNLVRGPDCAPGVDGRRGARTVCQPRSFHGHHSNGIPFGRKGGPGTQSCIVFRLRLKEVGGGSIPFSAFEFEPTRNNFS